MEQNDMNQGKKNAPSLSSSLATDLSEKASESQLFPKRLERYGRAKGRNLEMQEYIKTYHPARKKLISDMSECGSYLLFRDFYTIGKIKLTGAKTCKKHLLCPLCAIRRGAKTLSKYHKRFQHLTNQDNTLKPYMVTFTVKDGPDLAERFNHLKQSLKKYHHRRSLKRKQFEVEKADAAVWSYEIKRGKNSGDWHPHVHSVWLTRDEINHEKLSKEWQKFTGDSFIVDVRPITPEDPIKGFLEVFKYAVKFSDQPLEDTWHCYETLSPNNSRTNLIGSFGKFRGIKEAEELLDDTIGLDELPYIERLYSYTSDYGYVLNKEHIRNQTTPNVTHHVTEQKNNATEQTPNVDNNNQNCCHNNSPMVPRTKQKWLSNGGLQPKPPTQWHYIIKITWQQYGTIWQHKTPKAIKNISSWWRLGASNHSAKLVDRHTIPH